MFTSHLNEQKAIMLCRYAHPYDPADYDGYHAAFQRVVVAARTHQRPILLLVDLDDGYPQANAVQRKNIGEAWGKVPDLGGIIAIVTTSALIRGIITAIEWFMKNSPNRRETRAYAHSNHAVAWLAEQGGVSPAELHAAIEGLRARPRSERAAS